MKIRIGEITRVRDIEKISLAVAEAIAQMQLLGSDGVSGAVSALFKAGEALRGSDQNDTAAARLIEETISYSIAAYAGSLATVPPHAAVVEFVRQTLSKVRTICRQEEVFLTSEHVSFPLNLSIFDIVLNDVVFFFRDHDHSDRVTSRTRLSTLISEGWSRTAARSPTYFSSLFSALLDLPAYSSDYIHAWRLYRSNLISQFEDQVVFGEEASGVRLAQAYVPLRCWWGVRDTSSKDNQRQHVDIDAYQYDQIHVANLSDTVKIWLKEYNPVDRLRFISGGPGSGKSTFAKKLVADLSSEEKWRVFSIPLQRLSGSDHLEARINQFFLRDISGPFSGSLTALSGYGRDRHLDWLFVFDGLDELAKEGAGSESAAQDFASALADLMSRIPDGVHARFLVLGRAPSMQEARRRLSLGAGKTVYVADLLPFTTKHQSYEFRDCEIIGDSNLLQIDQRPILWRHWAAAKGKSLAPPPAITASELEDITKEPLLAHLLIVSGYVEEGWKLAAENRNRIYEAIFDKIWKRESEKESRIDLNDLGRPAFLLLLEALGVAAWRGGGRTGDQSAFEEVRNTLLPASVLGKIAASKNASLANVALIFYTRKDESGNRGYEFVHKSFGEYLTACALHGAFQRWRNQLVNDDIEFEARDFLSRWRKLAGAASITAEVYGFLSNQFRLTSDDSDASIMQFRAYAETLAALINAVHMNGFPISEGKSYRDLETEQRVAEQALWCMLDIVARIGYPERLFGKKHALGWSAGPIKIPALLVDSSGVHKLLYRQGDLGEDSSGVLINADSYIVAGYGEPSIALMLSRLYLPGIFLRPQNYSTFDLEGCYLRNIMISAGHLYGWNLRNTDLERSDLSHTKMSYVSFKGARLNKANFQHVVFDKNVEFKPRSKKDVVTTESNIAGYRSPRRKIIFQR